MIFYFYPYWGKSSNLTNIYPWRLEWNLTRKVGKMKLPFEILLMEEIPNMTLPNNHVEYIKTLVNNGINYLPTSFVAGFLNPSTISLSRGHVKNFWSGWLQMDWSHQVVAVVGRSESARFQFCGFRVGLPKVTPWGPWPPPSQQWYMKAYGHGKWVITDIFMG